MFENTASHMFFWKQSWGPDPVEPDTLRLHEAAQAASTVRLVA